MELPRPAPRRLRSRLLAFATVALAAAPAAQADTYYWWGQNYDAWSDANWVFSAAGQHVRSSIVSDLYFGVVNDTNGLVTNDIQDSFVVRSLMFTGQSWSVGGKSIQFAGGGTISVVSTSAATTIGNALIAEDSLTLGIASGSNLTLAGLVSGTGPLVKTGAGTLTLTGTNSCAGGTTISAGTVSAAGFNNLGSGPVSIAAGSRLTVTSYGGIYSGLVSGAGSVDWEAASQIFFKGANSYTGGTTVGAGQFIVGRPTGNYLVRKDAELSLFDLDSDTQAMGGSVSGEGVLGTYARGTTTLSGTSSHTGGTNVNFGTLLANAVNALGNGPVTVGSTATLVLNANNRATALTGAGSVLLNGTSVLTLSTAADSTVSVPITGTGGLTKQGAGTLTFSGGTAAYGGATTIEAGKLRVMGNNFRSGSVVAQAGTTFQFDGAGSAFMKTNVSGAGNFLKTGTGRLLLDGTLANTGSVRVDAGAVDLVSPAQMSGLSLASGARFSNDAQGTVEFSRAVVTQGEFVTTGGSRTVFDGLVSGAGGFSGFGEVRFDGGYHPGNSPASVTFQGDMTLGSSNDLTMELGGTTLGTGYDHLSVLGTAALGGALNVAYYGGFTASLGQSFDLFDFAHESGTFASVSLPTLSNGLHWDTSRLYTTGTIQAVPEPASLAGLGVGALALLRRRKC